MHKATYYTIPTRVYNHKYDYIKLTSITKYVKKNFPIKRGDLIRTESTALEDENKQIYYSYDDDILVYDGESVVFFDDVNLPLYEEPDYFTIAYWTNCIVYDKRNPYAVEPEINSLCALRVTEEMRNNLNNMSTYFNDCRGVRRTINFHRNVDLLKTEFIYVKVDDDELNEIILHSSF
jgi:hypothetical protein